MSRPSPSTLPLHPKSSRPRARTCVLAGQYDRCACETVWRAPATTPTGPAPPLTAGATRCPVPQGSEGGARWADRVRKATGGGRGGLRVVGPKGQAGAQSLGGWGARGNKNRRDFVEGGKASGMAVMGTAQLPRHRCLSVCACACACALALTRHGWVGRIPVRPGRAGTATAH